MFISGLIGFAFFAAFPVAPPRLADRGIVDTVTEYSESYRALQPPALTNKYAAFPSLHAGWNLVGIVLFQATTHRAGVCVRDAGRDGVRGRRDREPLHARRRRGAAIVLVGLAVASYWGVRTIVHEDEGPGRRIGPFASSPLRRRASVRQPPCSACRPPRRSGQAIEADVHLYRGRLEVRHLKTLGPIPLLWDRWRLANPFRRRLVLAELLAGPRRGGPSSCSTSRDATPASPKGWPRRSPRVGARAATPRSAPVTGRSSGAARRSWVRLVHSVGSARQLRRLLRRHRGHRLEGVTIHERLLDSLTVRAHEPSDVILAWPVNTLERAQELIRLEVEGLISDRPSLVHSAVGAEN